MTRRSRRHVRSKEKRPSGNVKSLSKLRSSKKIQAKKKVLLKSNAKTKFTVRKVRKIKHVVKNKALTDKKDDTPVPEEELPSTLTIEDSVNDHDEADKGESECSVDENALVICLPSPNEVREEETEMEVKETSTDDSTTVPEEMDTTDQEGANVPLAEQNNQNISEEKSADSSEKTDVSENEADSVATPQNFCTICKKTIDLSISLTQHMKQHATNNQVHQCSICSKSLSSASSLDRHMLVHSGERPFKCKLCNMSFTTNGNMHRHMRTHGELADSPDGIKSDRRKDSSKAKAVEESETDEKMHCPVCGKAFLCKYGLQSHMETHPNDPILCQKCDTISANYTAHIDHKCNNLGSNIHLNCYHSVSCGFRDLSFMDFTTDKFSLVSKSYCEQNIKRPSSAFHVFECSVCKKAFPCGRALKLHQKIHENSKIPTYCPTCQCDFAAASFLQLHQLKHRSAEHCFNNPLRGEVMNQLAQSQPPHAGKEDFLALLNLQTKESQLSILKSLKSCQVKEDNFENMDYFVHGKVKKEENRIVDTESVNSNATTNNDFADIQSIISLTSKAPLISSAQTSPIAARPASPLPYTSVQQPQSPQVADSASASPETPSKEEVLCISDKNKVSDVNHIDSCGSYSCKICTQKFKNVNTLKKHCKLHIQRGSNYSCNLCSYVSVDKSTLIRHLRTHNGERPFQCVICKYAFTTKANCERHVRKRHKKFGKAEIRNAMQYNPNMSLRGSDPTTTEISNSETVCKYCGVDFKFNRVLRHHLRSLHNSCNRKPFSCKICKFGFSTKNNCIRHVLKQHPNLKDKLRSVVIPNAQIIQTPNVEFNSSTDNSNSSSVTQPNTEQNQPLDLHCDNTSKPLDLQSENQSYDFNTNETVIAAEGLVSLSEAPPLQEEPLDLAARPLDLSCKPIAAITKKFDPKPSSIFAATAPCVCPPVENGFLDLSTSKPAPVIEHRTHSTPVKPITEGIRLPQTVSPKDINIAHTPGQKLRSFTCVYCSAGFTLKSNMERHIKRKHPEFARPTRSRNYIPSIVTPNLQKQNSATLSDKTRDALRHVLSNKVQQIPTCKTYAPNTFQKAEESYKVMNAPSNMCAAVNHIPETEANANVTLDLTEKNKTIAIVDLSSRNVIGLPENTNENCSDLASVSSVICTANSPQFKQYLEKTPDLENINSHQENKEKEETKEISNEKKTDSPSVSCPFCSRKFPWTSSLRRHILTHTGQKPYKCPKCSLWFTTKSNCERHLIRKHGQKGDLITRSVPDRPFKCNHCLTSTFSTQGNLRKHFYLKHWTKSYLGMSCKTLPLQKSVDKPSLTTEDKTDIPNIPAVTSQEHSYSQQEKNSPILCHFCDEKFQTLPDLSKHMLNHKNIIYMCYICRKTFPSHYACYNHFKISHSLIYMQLVHNKNLNIESLIGNQDTAEMEVESYNIDESISSVACMLCFQKMTSIDNFQQHFKKHLQKECCESKLTNLEDPQTSKEVITIPEAQEILAPDDASAGIKKSRNTKNKVKNSLLYLFAPAASCSPGKVTRSNNPKMEMIAPEEGSDLIQNLLGIHDSKIIDEMLASADSAARLLGVKEV